VSRIISALEPQKRSADRVNVYIDGAFAFGLNAIDAAGLRVGQALSDSDIEMWRARDEVQRAYERALRLLGQRAHSTAEIRRTLVRAKVPDATIDATLARLEANGYLDDLAFAQAWLADRQMFRPISSRAVRYQLRAKGVADTTIDEVLAGFDAAEAAYRAVRTQARRLAGRDQRAVYARLVPFLSRRGFDYDTARVAIERLLEELRTDSTTGVNSLGGDNDAEFDQE
jgi:regulatory protein